MTENVTYVYVWAPYHRVVKLERQDVKSQNKRETEECWSEVFGEEREGESGETRKGRKKWRDGGTGVGESQSPINVFVG